MSRDELCLCRDAARGARLLSVFVGLLLGLSGTVLKAQDEPAVEEEPSGPRITFHGYLTQAYAQSEGHLFLGISEDGTSDYRTAALQVRADLSDDDAFVLQLSHERVGESPVQALKSDVELDWVFYQRRFGSSSVKVGRVPIPFGLYNEVLDVGTLLPFYRPSLNFYGEAAYGTETVDGIVASHRFGPWGDGWGLLADVHYGNWTFVERSSFTSLDYRQAQVHDSLGAELWLDTPVPGLRIGTGAMRYELTSQLTGPSEWQAYHLSLAGEFGRLAAHAEHKDVDLGIGHTILSYVHLGVEVTDRLTINGQKDLGRFSPPAGRNDKFDDDLAAGVSYAFRPTLVLKAEHHWNETKLWVEDVLPLGPLATTFTKTRYWIVSLTTSF